MSVYTNRLFRDLDNAFQHYLHSRGMESLDEGLCRKAQGTLKTELG